MKVRIGAGGTNLKTISALHVRTVAGAGGLKTISDAHVRIGAGGTNLKDFWTPGGGGVGGRVKVSPFYYSSSSASSHSNASDYTADTSGPPTPTSYTWSITSVTNGTATIISGQGTATARVNLTASGGAPATCGVSCAVHFNDGSDDTDSASKQHHYTGA